MVPVGEEVGGLLGKEAEGAPAPRTVVHFPEKDNKSGKFVFPQNMKKKLIRKLPVLLVNLGVRVQLLRRFLEVLLDGGEKVPLGGGTGLARIPELNKTAFM